MPAATSGYLSAHPAGRLYALGGPAAAAAPTATALIGTDRYGTAAKVAASFFAQPTAVGLASGTVFADALAGGAHIAGLGGPILLADPNSATLNGAAVAYLNNAQSALSSSYAYGGSGALPDTLLSAFQTAGG
jgi:phytoene dehydrogenase-like protein